MKRRRRLEQVEQALQAANRKTDHRFVQDYLQIPHAPHAPWSPTWDDPSTGSTYSLRLCQPRKTMASPDLDACFALVRATSQADYEASSSGWDPSAKRDEMSHPDLRYILVKDPDSVVHAFTSLMPTIEEGQPVIYCYEIHLEPALRGTGLARLLMGLLETVAHNMEVVHKVMLTVFTCNKRAVGFYQRCGFVRDGISPQPRTLRGGKVKMPEYEILSKRVENRPATTTGGAPPDGVPDEAASRSGGKRKERAGESALGPRKQAKIARLDCATTGL
ncbi:hypothetical protein KVR01_007048 [Diaporthe batatas]|uniref:uncharacterized protein n=1 Tax=Diaporthe batatas TaxID=748121 RepID=UPI001D0381B9|nr:uncharacterized protein KVR01_007048 [Diaporthe batatas]KAG8163751.1 hypothetical protein KVR01_007048 [Diaporthe batatas]